MSAFLLSGAGMQGRERLGLAGLAGSRGVRRSGRTWGFWPSESCLTISSEERETWTAASLRGFVVVRPGKPEETS